MSYVLGGWLLVYISKLQYEVNDAFIVRSH